MTADVVRSVLVSRDAEVHSSNAVFAGTRLPVDTLVDYLESGYDLDEFLDQFPSVRREQAVAALEILRDTLLAE
ncbi:MAG: DUF433 domain-containing protein [Chloroflexota bacterium]